MEHSSNRSQVKKERGQFGKRLRFDFYPLTAAFLIVVFALPLAHAEDPSGSSKEPGTAAHAAEDAASEPLLQPEILGPTDTVLSEPAANGSAPDAAAAKKLAGFGHKLVLNPYTGMPSVLIFSSVEDTPAEVRALLTLDGRLLAVPLGFHVKTKTFVGTFPTPKRSLTYQFQVLLPEGRLAISEQFKVDPNCEKSTTEEIGKSAATFPAQTGLLQEALELDKESETLQYLINSIELVLKDK